MESPVESLDLQPGHRATLPAPGAGPGIGTSRGAPFADAGGLSLQRLLQAAPPTVSQVAAIGAVLLERVAGLEEAGDGHGSLTAQAVEIRPGGRLVVVPPRQPHRDPGQEGTDVRAVGRILCEALGPSLGRDADALALLPGDSAMVLITAEALANGALGRTAAGASLGFRQRLARLTTPEQLDSSLRELAATAIELQSRPQRVPAPAGTGTDTTRSSLAGPRPGSGAGYRVALLGAIAFCLLAGVGVIVVGSLAPGGRVSGSPPAVAPGADRTVPAPLPKSGSRPTPAVVPAYGPPAAGGVRQVSFSSPGCSPGAACPVTVEISFAPGRRPVEVDWSVMTFARCSGAEQLVPGGRFLAPAGWNRAILTGLIRTPSTGGPIALVALTDQPDRAAAPALEIGPPDCPG